MSSDSDWWPLHLFSGHDEELAIVEGRKKRQLAAGECLSDGSS
jgi:hypothetical protein